MLLFSDMLYMLVRYGSQILEAPDVDFIRQCGVVVFAFADWTLL